MSYSAETSDYGQNTDVLSSGSDTRGEDGSTTKSGLEGPRRPISLTSDPSFYPVAHCKRNFVDELSTHERSYKAVDS